MNGRGDFPVAHEYDEGMNARYAMCRSCFAACLAWIAAVAGAAGQEASDSATLVLLDGQQVSARSLEIAAGKLTGDGVPEGLTLDDLRRIDLPQAAAAETNPAVIAELRGGGRILGKSVAIADERCQIEWPHGEKLAVSIDVVRALRLEPAVANPEFDKAVAAPAADADRIFFKVDGKFDRLAGLVISLTADELKFQLEGQERTLPRNRLYGIAFAQAQAEDDKTGCLVLLHGGSRLAGDLTGLAGGKATLELPGGGKVAFPWSAAARVEVRSQRVAFLSDLKPTSVEESALVTLTRPWRRDANVLGKPLTLGGKVFDKGIGVHARSSLTFAAAGQYDTLAAVIGIDAAAGGKGDCVYSVLGDGQPIFTKRVKGSDPPQEIRLEISRCEQVTLLVEPGADLDLADHANWCDARFIKAK
jgi:hypothetical protein